MTPFAITVGAGLTRPQGRAVALSPSSFAAILSGLPATEESWWSPHSWRGSYRLEKEWLSSCAAVIDVDFKFKDTSKRCKADPSLIREPTLDEVEALAAAARMMPGTHWHPTPGGARVIAMFAEPCVDRELAIKAIAGLCKLASELLDELPYEVDLTTSLDLARLFYTPNAFAKGVQRKADVTELRAVPYTPEELAAHAPPPEEPKAKPASRPMPTSIGAAIEKWNADHRIDIPRNTAPCPVCKDSASFGQLPGDDQRWYCFSSDHPDNIGVRGQKGYHGDALDLDCHWRGLSKVDVLRDDGYLPKSKAPARDEAMALTTRAGANLVDRRRPLKNNSFDTACTVIGREAWPTHNDQNIRGVLDGKVKFNEMTGMIEIGDRDIRDVDVDIVRRRIELQYHGGIDKDGKETGLRLARNDVERALAVVADEHSYHPVRAYLASLAWDTVPRLAHVADEILGAKDSEINRAIIRKTFVSAVARVFEPGCKVDTMLVLQGAQGAKKSSFFKALSAPWFIDTAIDISADATRAFQVMRRAWIFEWAELETLLKARDFSSVKAFLSSTEDTYIAKYGRHPIPVKRSGIIVGTINPEEFLNDETGARRFWPLVCGEINLALAEEWRDGLWAESKTLYLDWVNRGRRLDECPWWLTAGEERMIAGSHDVHRVRDPWEEFLIMWATDREPFTTSEAMAAIGKELKDWKADDQKRVSRILKAHKFERKPMRNGKVVTQVWKRPDPVTLL